MSYVVTFLVGAIAGGTAVWLIKASVTAKLDSLHAKVDAVKQAINQ
jgi:uncharacterized membrane protein